MLYTSIQVSCNLVFGHDHTAAAASLPAVAAKVSLKSAASALLVQQVIKHTKLARVNQEDIFEIPYATRTTSH